MRRCIIPRTYTKRDPLGGDIIKANDYNDNWSAITEVLNGTVDHLQVDYNTASEVAEPFDSFVIEAINANAPNGQATTIGQLNTYATNTRYNSPGNEETPIVVIEQSSSDYQTGWNELRSLSALEPYTWLLVPCKEGMLRGSVMVDFEHRVGANVILAGETPLNGPEGFDDWVEIGVFVNNILIATTGRLTPGRFTVNLPWALPIGSQVVTVDIRWRAFFENLQTSTNVTSVERRPFNIYGVHLWCRNQCR